MSKITKEKYTKLLGAEKLKSLTGPVIQEILECSEREGQMWFNIMSSQGELKGIFGDTDIVLANVKLAKTKQFQQDKNRIETKAFRDYVRMENALVALNEALLEKLDQVTLNIRKPKITQPIVVGKDQAIIQLADTHFNELVDLSDNTYDFTIASQRMMLYAAEIKR